MVKEEFATLSGVIQKGQDESREICDCVIVRTDRRANCRYFANPVLVCECVDGFPWNIEMEVVKGCLHPCDLARLQVKDTRMKGRHYRNRDSLSVGPVVPRSSAHRLQRD